MRLAAAAACVLWLGIQTGAAQDPTLSSETIAAAAVTAEASRGYQPLVAALHVHSRYSNGHREILELASYAHQRKLDVLGITDSFLTRVRYGLPPLRHLVSWSNSRQSVMSRGIGQYLDSLAQAQRQFPDVLLLPGVEAAPFYYWRGTPGRNLELFDFDRHVIVFANWNPATWRDLPVIENERWSNTRRSWTLAAGPAVLLLAGLLIGIGTLLTRGRTRRGGRFAALAASAMVLAGIAWAFDRFPFAAAPDPYSGKHDIRPFQKLIDYAEQNGGASFWSYPEAGYEDVELGGARMISSEHPEDLALTERYRGFEGIYGGKFTITRPGALWDRLLMAYLEGSRTTWPSVVSGIDFHDFDEGGGWYELDRGQTVLWASSKTTASVLEALKAGRNYCLFQPVPGKEVVLRDYAVRTGDRLAVAGERVRTSGPFTFTAAVAWNGDPVPEQSFKMEVVRNGKVIHEEAAPLPLQVRLQEDLPAGNYYYRLRVILGSFQELLANPIFVDVER